jgi:hypothetical protein
MGDIKKAAGELRRIANDFENGYKDTVALRREAIKVIRDADPAAVFTARRDVTGLRALEQLDNILGSVGPSVSRVQRGTVAAALHSLARVAGS